MDGHDPGEDEEQNCLQVVRCSKGHVPSLGHWTLQAFRSLTCQSSLLRSSSFQGNRILSPAAPVVPLLHRSFSRGLLSSGYTRWKPNSVKCIAKPHLDVKMQDDDGSLNGRLEARLQADVIQGESDSHLNTEFVGLDAQNLSSRVSSVDHARDNDDFVSSDGPCISCECSLRNACCQSSTPAGRLSLDANHPTAFWEDREERKEKRRSELDEMKERFAKLLLGEDMSGGAKGVCTALAISNAITNLSASIFGDLWRLEPLSLERKVRWKQEMEWLLSVSDHIVELVPSWQKFEDGSNIEVMIAKPRVDLHTNLPALRKLDSMLLAFLDSCQETEFWYVEEGVVVSDEDVQNMNAASSQRREENWWLPTPKVAAMGLSAGGRKSLQHKRKCMNQILKASAAINSQILCEMEISTGTHC